MIEKTMCSSLLSNLDQRGFSRLFEWKCWVRGVFLFICLCILKNDWRMYWWWMWIYEMIVRKKNVTIDRVFPFLLESWSRAQWFKITVSCLRSQVVLVTTFFLLCFSMSEWSQWGTWLRSHWLMYGLIALFCLVDDQMRWWSVVMRWYEMMKSWNEGGSSPP